MGIDLLVDVGCATGLLDALELGLGHSTDVAVH